MSYAVCPDCGKHINVFGDSHVDEIADKYKLPVLAKMPKMCIRDRDYTLSDGVHLSKTAVTAYFDLSLIHIS